MASKKEMMEAHDCGECCGHETFGKPILWTLIGVLVVYSIFFLGTLVRNNIKKYDTIGQADKMERTISVNGFAKVTAKNDIAMTTIGYNNIDMDIGKAQLENKKVMDNVLAELRRIGIADKDMQTDYSITPEYNYTETKGTELKGYRVTNNVIVKIRDLSKITDVLNIPGKFGANNVGSLSFTIDETENLKNQARQIAIAEAKKKAAQMAMALGVRLVEIINYSDYEQGPMYYPYYANKTVMAEGLGNAAGAAPADVVSGSRDIGMNVMITYRIAR